MSAQLRAAARSPSDVDPIGERERERHRPGAGEVAGQTATGSPRSTSARSAREAISSLAKTLRRW